VQDFWIRITDFGNSAVTLPLAFFAAAYVAFGLRRPRVGGALLLATVGGAGFTLLVLKLLFRLCSCGEGLVVSPSGHAAMSAAVYGCLALLVSREVPYRASFLVVTAVFVAAIAFSRLEVNAHSWAEVAVGLAVGTTCAVGFGAVLGREPPVPLRWKRFLAALALVILATYGLDPPIEQTIQMVADDMQSILSPHGGTRHSAEAPPS